MNLPIGFWMVLIGANPIIYCMIYYFFLVESKNKILKFLIPLFVCITFTGCALLIVSKRLGNF